MYIGMICLKERHVNSVRNKGIRDTQEVLSMIHYRVGSYKGRDSLFIDRLQEFSISAEITQRFKISCFYSYKRLLLIRTLVHHSVSPKASALPSSTPRGGETKPTGRPATRRLSCRSVRSPIPSILGTGLISTKPALDQRGSDDVISPTAKRGPKPGEEVIQMGCHKPCGLIHGGVRTREDECHDEHG